MVFSFLLITADQEAAGAQILRLPNLVTSIVRVGALPGHVLHGDPLAHHIIAHPDRVVGLCAVLVFIRLFRKPVQYIVVVADRVALRCQVLCHPAAGIIIDTL